MKFFLLFILFVICFCGCIRYTAENVIGAPRAHLDSYDNFYVILVEHEPEYIYNKFTLFFKDKEADVYRTKKNDKIYVRNLKKIFVHALDSTCLGIYISKISDTQTQIKFVSKNHELAEFFKDMSIDLILEKNSVQNNLSTTEKLSS
ncbi:hypothetical protein ACFL5N_00110 [bacterium]